MILVLTGPVHSGKTTLLRRLLPGLEEMGFPASGYLSLTVMKDGEIVGYDLFDIKNGQTTPFLRREGGADWQKVGSYFFLPAGLEAAAAAILGSKPGEILIIDEVGPMELAGRGVWPAMFEVLSRTWLDCLLVIRRPLLDSLRDRLGGTPIQVFDVTERKAQRSLLKVLSGLKSIRTS